MRAAGNRTDRMSNKATRDFRRIENRRTRCLDLARAESINHSLRRRPTDKSRVVQIILAPDRRSVDEVRMLSEELPQINALALDHSGRLYLGTTDAIYYLPPSGV